MEYLDDLRTLWKQQPAGPDLTSFFRRRTMSPLVRLAALRLDQQLRWNSPQPWLAETYLQQLAPHPEGVDWTLELAAGEWLSRTDSQPLTADQLEARFPQLAGLPAHLVRATDTSDVAQRIDQVCDRLELLHKSGTVKPRLEYALANLSVEHRSRGLPLLLQAELEARPGDQPTLTGDELIQRFPQFVAEVLQVFQGAVPRQDGVQTPPMEPPLPTVIGSYRVIKKLGRGGFGTVYLAEDPNTHQQVAIKVARTDRLQNGDLVQAYLEEARIASSLDHPRIVPVLYCGQSVDFPFYIVTKYIEGCTLAEQLQREKLSAWKSAELIATMADALHHAHTKKVRAHRDVKPGNILLDKAGQPFLTDFGLALPERSLGSGPTYCGTPDYMSPEQARKEGHLVDERSDIFSLGIVFHELLTGHRPFSGHGDELLAKIASVSNPVRPLTELDDRIPAELERICLRMLAKRPHDRYHYASDLEQDLREFLNTGPVGKTSARTTSDIGMSHAPAPETLPQGNVDTPADPHSLVDQFTSVTLPGLRSFDADYADYFLHLLPGARDRHNLPACVAWWKTHLEKSTGPRSFRVGVMYGPSGCGKSSLIRAGILPRLQDSVATCCISATPNTTAADLLAEIRLVCDPTLPELSLTETLSTIRRGGGLPSHRKLVLVLDQFEQWLHKHAGQEDSELLAALRQCDGQRVQAVILVRDDFWMPLTRFLATLDLPLEQYRNAQNVDLFDPSHARKVLRLFGVAYGRLPRRESDQTSAQEEFLDRAIRELTEEDKVICVRVALFARMFKGRDWSPEMLEGIGGAAGVGRAFLEETFTSKRARPEYSRHKQAATQVLKRLIELDEQQTTEQSGIKGMPRTADELQAVAGYAERAADFADLLRILDSDLRLITPTEVESPGTAAGAVYYQLTHDYLVPSIREWLRLNQTPDERTLEDRTWRWSENREARQLPSLVEWGQILLRTDRRRWTGLQRTMMRATGKVHSMRLGTFMIVLLLAGLVVRSVLAANADASLAVTIQKAKPNELIDLLRQADTRGAALDSRLLPLIQAADEPTADAPTKLAAVPARLVLVARDEKQLPPLQDALLSGELTYVEPIRTRLRLHAAKLHPQWLELLRNPAEPAARRFRAALGLAGLEGDQSTTEWTAADIEFIALELSGSFAEYQPQLRELLRPLAERLVPVLDVLFDKPSSTEDQQINATMALVDFAGDDPELLARLLTRASQRQTEILYPKVAEHKSGPVRDGLLALTKEQPDENLGQLARVRLGRRRANAAITLLRQGERDGYFDALRITDDPESLSQFVHRCRAWGVTPLELLESFERCRALRATSSGAAKRVESRVMYGLLIALGSYSLDEIPEATREELFGTLRELYDKDPSAAVHSGSGWLLRTWGRDADVAKLDEVEVPYDASGEREWFRLRVGVAPLAGGLFGAFGIRGRVQYHSLTFVVFPAGEYPLGSPEFEGGELERNKVETAHLVKLTRPFALCDREVTWGLYDVLAGGERHAEVIQQEGWGQGATEPACAVDWFEWITFCRRLTVAYRGDDERWQCYAEPEQDGSGVPGEARLLVERGGFRMPTEAEWEVGARAGQRTAYTFGSDVSLLDSYGWFEDNSDKRARSPATKPPGLGGLHDIQGNLFEWVHDRYDTYDGGAVVTDPQGASSDQGQGRVIRGGSWDFDAARCRTAFRISYVPTSRDPLVGFRLALSPSVNQPEAASQEEK